MAPSASLVHSANHPRGDRTPPQSSHAFRASPLPKGGPVNLPHKGRSPSFSFVDAESSIEDSRIAKKGYEQRVSVSIPYRTRQKQFPPPRDYLLPVDSKRPYLDNLTVKTEPESDYNLSPLLRSLLAQDHLPTTQAVRHDHKADIKIEPDQNPKGGSAPGAFDEESSGPVAVPDICSSGNPPNVPLPTTAAQPSLEARSSHPPEAGPVATKIPCVAGHSSRNLRGLIPTHLNKSILKLSLLKRRKISPHAKFVLYAHFGPLLQAFTGQSPARVTAHSSLNPKPPQDGGHEPPNYHGVPQASPLYKSLYGLPQCLQSQAQASVSTPHSSGVFNTPTFYQGSTGNSGSNSNATGRANDSTDHSGQRADSDSDDMSFDLGLDDLDANSLYELSLFYLSLALERDTRAGSVQTPQGLIPGLFHPSPKGPVPWPIQPNGPDIPSDSSAVRSSPTSETRMQPQHDLSAAYTGGPGPGAYSTGPGAKRPRPHILSEQEASHIHRSNRRRTLPNSIFSGPSIRSYSSYEGDHSATRSSDSTGDFNQYFHTFRANGSGLGPFSPMDADQTSPPGSRTCHVCSREFDRLKSLMDHMYQHDGIKRNRCRFCDKHYAHGSGLSRHLKDAHGQS